LGVTPSAWFFASKVFENESGSLSSYGTAQQHLAQNAYLNSSSVWTYKNSASAVRYEQGSANHSWFTAPSGTAGNAITFTQSMTLDASGNLLVAATSPIYNAANRGNITLGGSASSLLFLGTSGTTGSYVGHFQFNNSLEVWNGANGPMLFATNNTERARIDSSGNLLVGTTSAVTPAPSKIGILYEGASQFGLGIKTSDNSGSAIYFVNSSSTAVGNIALTSSSTAYNTSSDYRLKNTIAPMTGALAKVALLKPCTYKWNADGSDGEGFIAHELQSVVPQCVTGEKDAVDAEGKPQYQGIDTSFLVATLTAAIQEQQAIITALTARVAALESI
jgi:hypothetical protein